MSVFFLLDIIIIRIIILKIAVKIIEEVIP